MRWRLRLSEFDYEVRYKKGLLNTQADALSRLSTLVETELELEVDLPCFCADEYSSEDEEDAKMDYIHSAALLALESEEVEPTLLVPITLEELVRSQASDTFCQSICSRLDGEEEVPSADDDRGFLIRRVEANEQIVIPQELRTRVLHISHFAKVSGHPGGRKLYNGLRQFFYWPSMSVDCYDTAKNCVTCAKNRIFLRKNKNYLKLFPAETTLEFVAIDILGELLRTPRGNRFLLVISDRFSKLARTVPLKRITAVEVAKAFVHHWVLVYGPPLLLLADNGKQSISKLFHEICRLLGVKNLFTTTYHPQTNGQVERFNRTIIAAIRHYVSDHPHDWDLFTDALTYACNTQPHDSTSIAPFELVLSRPPPRLSFDAEPTVGKIGTAAQYQTKWRVWLSALMSTAKVELEKRQARYKKNFDNRIGTPKDDIVVGYHVFIRKDYFNPTKEYNHKLSPVVTGPYLVRQVDKHTVVIEIEDKTRERVSKERIVLTPSPSGVIISSGVRTEGEDDTQYGYDARKDTTTPPGEAVFDVVTPTGDVAENVDEPVPEDDEEPAMGEDKEDGYANVRDKTRLVEDLEGTEGVEEPPCMKNEWPIGVDAVKSAYVGGNDDAGVREPDEAHSTEDEDKNVASPTYRRTPELGKTLRSGDSVPHDGSLSNATVQKSTISKPTTPIRGLADVPPLREISSKINSPAVYTRFSRKRKPKPQTSRTEISESNPHGLAIGGVLSPQEKRLDPLPNAEDGNFPTKSIPTPGDISGEDGELTPEKRITHDGGTAGNPENGPVVVVLDKDASQFAVPSMTYSPNASGRQLQSVPDISTRRIPSAPFEVQRIIAHGVADNDEFLLKVRWHGFSSKEDTWEPIQDLPYNMVVRYCRNRNIALPSNMEDALV